MDYYYKSSSNKLICSASFIYKRRIISSKLEALSYPLKTRDQVNVALHSNLLWWCVLIAFGAFRVWLIAAQTPHIIAGAGHDDALFVELCENLLAGVWLGHANDLTLAKGPCFPVFLALNYFTGIPFVVTLQILYVLSGLLLIFVLRRLGLGRAGLLLTFLLFIFSPSLASLNARRLVRDSFYTSLLIGMLSAALGLVDAIQRKRHTVGWCILCGFLLGSLWVTREEGMALLPPLVLLALGSFFFSRRYFCSLRSTVLVGAFGALVPLGVLSLNYAFYEVTIVTEMQSEYFTHAYGALSRVKHDTWRQYVPVPQHVREKIYKVSPAFASIRQFLEASSWVGPGCRYINPCDDLSSHFIWGFRKAVVQSRYYASLEDARIFYNKLALEVDSACDRGDLDCLPARSTLVPPYRSEYRDPLIEAYRKVWRYLISFEGLDPYNLVWSPSDRRSLQRIGKLLNYRRLDQIEQRTISGWMVSSSVTPLQLRIESSAGDVLSREAEFSSGRSVVAAIKQNFGVDLPAAAENSRFEVRTSCAANCVIHVIDSVSLKEAVFSLDDWQAAGPKKLGDFYFSIAAPKPHRDLSASKLWRMNLLDSIWPLYQICSLPLLWAAGIAYVSLLFRLRRTEHAKFVLLFAAALFLTISVRLALLAYIHVSSFDAINDLYCMPCYALLLIFSGMGLAVLTDYVISICSKCSTKSN